MASRITRHVPNFITCLNLFFGCIACIAAYEARYEAAGTLILGCAVLDFLDGMFARLLHAYSPIGKELDSLADDISFGLAPALIVFSLFREVHYPDFLAPLRDYFPYSAFLIAIFSALRLAKFNVDERQTSSFIGLPTPANTLFWASLATGFYPFMVSTHFNALYLLGMVLLSGWLMNAEVKMFSLKFKNLSWKSNRISYIFLIGCIPLFLVFKVGGVALAILWYVVLSVSTSKK